MILFLGLLLFYIRFSASPRLPKAASPFCNFTRKCEVCGTPVPVSSRRERPLDPLVALFESRWRYPLPPNTTLPCGVALHRCCLRQLNLNIASASTTIPPQSGGTSNVYRLTIFMVNILFGQSWYYYSRIHRPHTFYNSAFRQWDIHHYSTRRNMKLSRNRSDNRKKRYDV